MEKKFLSQAGPDFLFNKFLDFFYFPISSVIRWKENRKFEKNVPEFSVIWPLYIDLSILKRIIYSLVFFGAHSVRVNM